MSSLQHIGPLCLTYINDIWLRLILSCTSLFLFQQRNAIYLSQYSYFITSEIRKCIHHWVQYIWHRASRPVTCHWILASNILDSRYPWKLMWFSKNNFIFCNQVYVAVIWVMFCQIPWKYGARGLRRIWAKLYHSSHCVCKLRDNGQGCRRISNNCFIVPQISQVSRLQPPE